MRWLDSLWRFLLHRNARLMIGALLIVKDARPSWTIWFLPVPWLRVAKLSSGRQHFGYWREEGIL